ncbi:MAG: ABC transporter permease [Candidatus Kryptoniota bacterium]
MNGDIKTIAMNELLIAVRSKWVLAFSIVFAAISLAVSFAGTSGAFAGFQDFMRTVASLLNLSLYLVPLFSLILGAVSFTPAPDSGRFEFDLAQPITRTSYVLGKYFGLFLALTLATTAGFGIAGLVISFLAEGADVLAYIAFVLLSVTLGIVFLSISAFLSLTIFMRGPVLASSLALWFGFVILYDLVVMWVATNFEGDTLRTMLFVLLFGNPVDLVRVATLFIVGGKVIFGPTAGALLKFVGGTHIGVVLLVSALAMWGGCPLVIAVKIFSRKDI